MASKFVPIFVFFILWDQITHGQLHQCSSLETAAEIKPNHLISDTILFSILEVFFCKKNTC